MADGGACREERLRYRRFLCGAANTVSGGGGVRVGLTARTQRGLQPNTQDDDAAGSCVCVAADELGREAYYKEA